MAVHRPGLLIVTLVAVLSLTGARLFADPQAAPAKPPATPKELAKEQAAVARDAIRVIRGSYEKGLSLPAGIHTEIGHWSRRLVEAARIIGDKPELIKALKEHVQTTKDLMEFSEQRVKSGFKAISDLDVADAKYQYLEAQIWLAQEK